MERVLITGNTYPVKDAIRELGGRWNPRAKGWEVPADRADEARALVDEAPRTRPRRSSRYDSSRYVSNYTQFSDGTEYYVNKKGRCEDAPCCGCCS